VFSSFDIDAKINCAWVLIGLLYGGGDFSKTLSVSARCGDDSDCNPASAGGIVGTLLGYAKIPAFWKSGLAAIEAKPFPYTPLSLADAYRLTYNQALENVRRNGGRVDAARVTITARPIAAVRKEVGFEGLRPVERRPLDLDLSGEASFRFSGVGFAVNGEAVAAEGQKYVFKVAMTVDDKSFGIVDLPTDPLIRNPTPFWAYGLQRGPHEVRLRVVNPTDKAKIRLQDAVLYAEKN